MMLAATPPEASYTDLAVRQLKLCDDRGVIALRVLHVGGEGYGLVVEQLVVHLGVPVVAEQAPTHQMRQASRPSAQLQPTHWRLRSRAALSRSLCADAF